MKYPFNKHLLLIILFIVGIALLIASIYLFELDATSQKWLPELARALMGLSFGVIFGGIIKLIFDEYQERKKQDEKIKDFKQSVLNQLRKVFDSVDTSRLLMEAHKSAKTYSERMQQDIIPSIVTLFDIKRSLVDSKDIIDKEALQQLRINIHYMIAYIQALANEYKNEYPTLSNKQFLYEKLKEKVRDNFVGKITTTYPDNFFTDEILSPANIPSPPKWIWESINKLPHIGLFITDSYESPYRKMFVDFYENSKKILKDQPFDKTLPQWYEEKEGEEKKGEKFKKRMLEIDRKVESGPLEKGDSLVDKMVKYLEDKTKKILEEKSDSMH